MSKVLILTVTTGGGHNATAKAVGDELESRGIETRTVDVHLQMNRAMYTIVSKGYLLSINELRKLYAKVYGMLETRKGNSYKTSAIQLTNKLMAKKLYDYIVDYDPDVIVYSHVFAGELLEAIIKEHGLRAKTIGIVTDFAMHPFWEECLRTDYVVVANELLIPGACRKGFNANQVLPIGIPIHPKFSTFTDKRDMKIKLGLDPDTPTVLFMGGSMGYGNMAAVIAQLDQTPASFQIIAVCGSNSDAKEEIARMKTQKRVLSLGFVSNVDELMDASDCMITKPGGLTSSEALAKGIPMIIMNPIPGQEDRNADFLCNSGAAIKVSQNYHIDDALYQLTEFPERLEHMRRLIELIGKPNATRDLADHIQKLLKKENDPSKVTEVNYGFFGN